MKKIILVKIVLLFMIISSISIFSTIFFVKGQLDDIEYIFEKDIFIETSNPSFNESENLRIPYEYTKEYNASYTFINEKDKTNGTDINFIDSKSGNGLISIINNFNEHTKVLKIDFEASGSTLGYNNFDDTIFGTIEFWFSSSDASNTIALWFRHSTDLIFAIIINNDLIRIWSGAYDFNGGYTEPNWIHIRVDFESGGGGYNGLGADTFKVYINGVVHGAYTFNINVDHLDNIELQVANNAEIGYFDAIGYSWLDNYTIGNNLLPIIDYHNGSLEVDKLEFDLKGVHEQYEFGDTNAEGFTDIEINGGSVGIGSVGFSLAVGILVESTGDIGGTYRDNLNLISNFINISFRIIFDTLDGINGVSFFFIYDDNNNIITGLSITNDGKLWYQDGPDWLNDWIQLRDDLIIGEFYDINIFINYELDTVNFNYYIDDTFIEVYNYPLIFTGKSGVNKVNITSWCSNNNDILLAIDSVGIYDNGLSLSDSFGWITIETNKASFNVENNNLLFFNGFGNLSFGSVNGNSGYNYWDVFQIIRDIYSYENTSIIYNAFDEYTNTINNPILVITIKGKSIFYLNSLSIEGVKLIENSNEYFLSFKHSGVDTSESYFYVDNFNRLQFNLLTDDTELEYIQATFNILGISTDDTAISYTSIIDIKALGFFRINFTDDTSNVVQIPLIDTTSRYILSQNKTINSFTILITDNDVDTILGLTTGYIFDIQISYYLNVQITIITIAIIGMMIPLILIIIPTLAISNRIGNSAIIPMFILMSLILVATDIIPVWLFFIIMVSHSLFIFLKKDKVAS